MKVAPLEIRARIPISKSNRMSQRTGVTQMVLSRSAFGRRGAYLPTAIQFCIATGWCNRALAAIGLFPALETMVERITGLRPRGDAEMA